VADYVTVVEVIPIYNRNVAQRLYISDKKLTVTFSEITETESVKERNPTRQRKITLHDNARPMSAITEFLFSCVLLF